MVFFLPLKQNLRDEWTFFKNKKFDLANVIYSLHPRFCNILHLNQTQHHKCHFIQLATESILKYLKFEPCSGALVLLKLNLDN